MGSWELSRVSRSDTEGGRHTCTASGIQFPHDIGNEENVGGFTSECQADDDVTLRFDFGTRRRVKVAI